MPKYSHITRRDFLKGVTGAAAVSCLRSSAVPSNADTVKEKSAIYRIDRCPVHDGELRHKGVDSLLNVLSENKIHLYRTGKNHQWGSAAGLINPDDVVLLKVNCQWKFRGATNTDVVRGLIHRILGHPDGFSGEVVIFENGQMQGSFDGDPLAWGRYKDFPECAGVHVNAEDDTLTVDHLVNEIFADAPVSSYLLDSVGGNFISGDDHTSDGYRIIADEKISYPCFTTRGKHRIELREGIWNGKTYDTGLKLINLPVFKTHAGTGITGTLKNSYGIVSMKDNDLWRKQRHYEESGSQCGKMYSHVRMPDLNIVDAIWVTHEGHHRGYPADTTHRADILLAGIDPVALDYYGSKHILLPLGGSRAEEHDPNSFPGLINHISGAQEVINTNGGVMGRLSQQGDENITVISHIAES